MLQFIVQSEASQLLSHETVSVGFAAAAAAAAAATVAAVAAAVAAAALHTHLTAVLRQQPRYRSSPASSVRPAYHWSQHCCVVRAAAAATTAGLCYQRLAHPGSTPPFNTDVLVKTQLNTTAAYTREQEWVSCVTIGTVCILYDLHADVELYFWRTNRKGLQYKIACLSVHASLGTARLSQHSQHLANTATTHHYYGTLNAVCCRKLLLHIPVVTG
jgi:hypothetical protein